VSLLAAGRASHSASPTTSDLAYGWSRTPVFAQYPSAKGGWMIGDSWRADVQGALAVGMRAILVRSEHPEAPLRCATLDEVVDVVDGP
jgi:hypothetical protein